MDFNCYQISSFILYHRHVENCKPEEQIALLTDDKYTKVFSELSSLKECHKNK